MSNKDSKIMERTIFWLIPISIAVVYIFYELGKDSYYLF